MLFSKQTPAAGGDAFAQFDAAWCYDGNGYILNDTGTSLDVRIGASGSVQTLASGATLPIKLVFSMAELYVRRTDQSTAQVTVEAQVGTGSAGGGTSAEVGVIAAATAAAATASHATAPDAHGGESPLRRFARLARVRRVDMVGIGDSNQFRVAEAGIHSGWDRGWFMALRKRFNIYATHLVGMSETPSSGNGFGPNWTRSSIIADKGAAPAPFDQYDYRKLGAMWNRGLYVASWTAAVSGYFAPWFECAATYFKKNRTSTMAPNLQYQALVAKWATGGGAITPFSRMNVNPYTQLFSGPAVSTEAATDRLEWVERDIASGWSAESPDNDDTTFIRYAFGPGPIASAGITGKFYGLFHRIIARDVNAGVSFTTLLQSGGNGVYQFAQFLSPYNATTNPNGINPAALDLLLSSIVRNQVGDKVLLCRINSGVNDSLQTAALSFDGVNMCSTAEGFAANTQVCIDRLRESWLRLGYRNDNLIFLLTPTHPYEAGDTKNAFARVGSQAVALADPDHVVMCSLPAIGVTSTWLTANSYYDVALAHLNGAGYDAVAEIEAAALFD